MTVHLAGNLPGDELNGLAPYEKVLIEGHLARRQHLIIASIRVTGTKASLKDGFTPQPIVTLEHVEYVIDELSDEVLGMLRTLLARRTSKEQLDFPDADAEPPAPLELEAGTEAYTIVVEDTTKGKISVAVETPSGATIAKRNELPRKEYGDIPAGSYELVHLIDSPELQQLVTALIADYEAGRLIDPDADEVVDAEVVGEEGED